MILRAMLAARRTPQAPPGVYYTLSRRSSADVNLGSDYWRGSFALDTYAWVVDGTYSSPALRGYSESNGALTRYSLGDATLPAGYWRGGFGIGSRVHAVPREQSSTRAYDMLNGVLTYNSSANLDLGSSVVWRGGCVIGTRVWIADATNKYLRVWDESNGSFTRNSAADVSIASYLTSAILVGVFAVGNRLWALRYPNSGSPSLLAFDEANGVLTRNATADFAIGSGNWWGGAVIGTRVWICEDSSNYLRALDAT